MNIEEKYGTLLDFVKSFEKRAWDAWKPMQVFRSDNEVDVDNIKRGLLDEIQEEAENILHDIGEIE